MIEDLKEKAKELLTSKKVDVVIGYEAGTYKDYASPSFAKTAKDVDRFVWNKNCVNNLAIYITKAKGKVGIIAKGCDVKSIIGIIQENQINREDVVIIGIACDGVEIDGEKADKCNFCDVHTPKIYDILIGDKIESKESSQDKYKEVAEIENKSPEERWKYWKDTLSKCIRCYACRQVCPLCYCDKCFVDTTVPQWIPMSVNEDNNMMFHMIRAYHMASRCIGCGECQRACPMNIPLNILSKKMTKEVEEMFGYTPGVDIEAKPAIQDFNKKEDPDKEFIM
ncbi:MAG: 4Fe-4S dicluster domain-containing protein [bacterium]|nr:4Fe-4S dicluster domain-containing protein [bacterium]